MVCIQRNPLTRCKYFPIYQPLIHAIIISVNVTICIHIIAISIVCNGRHQLHQTCSCQGIICRLCLLGLNVGDT